MADGGQFVLDNVPLVLAKLLARVGTQAAEIDCFVPHQANGVLIGELAEQCGLADTHTHLGLERYGNVGSASVPVALDDAVRSGVIGAGSAGRLRRWHVRWRRPGAVVRAERGDGELTAIKRVGVVGCGLMDAGYERMVRKGRFVLEAVGERLLDKLAIFGRLDPDPVPAMPLVELIGSLHTAQANARPMAAVRMLESGAASAEEIDRPDRPGHGRRRRRRHVRGAETGRKAAGVSTTTGEPRKVRSPMTRCR